jgi:hypothetical protein
MRFRGECVLALWVSAGEFDQFTAHLVRPIEVVLEY